MTSRLPPPRRHSLALLSLPLAALLGCVCGTSTSPTAAVCASTTTTARATAAAASAAFDPELQRRFVQWTAAFRGTALAAGITEATLQAAFDDAHYLPRIVDLDRTQPEFTRTVWAYVDAIVSEPRVAQGREKLAQVRDAADAVAARYGVPATTVVAVWGMESNYGANDGDIPTISALATLGVEGRREAWAKSELLAALRIVQNGDIDAARMIGSWAGAMGQTQLLPSNFLAYAVDGDGDGRRDIWGSMPDVLASTANFLARSGWRAGEPWGVEVRLPAGFDAARADDKLRQSSDRWTAEGVQTIAGSPLPTMADGAILLPAGARGPAFLVGANFRALLRYNNSTSYALAVGLLAQRLDGGPGVQAAWPRDLAALGHDQLQALQAGLRDHGFDGGTPDGVMGPATRDALRRYQRRIGQPADGYPTLDLLQGLQAR